MLWVPESDPFRSDVYTSLSQEVFNVTVAEIETEVRPNGIEDDVRREAVAFRSIHPPILSTSVS
jgi:hypothetical protein